MKASEELMVLLELNGYDITKYKLKKFLEYDQSKNPNLYKHKKFQDMLVEFYTYQEKPITKRNPLGYRSDWGGTIQSLDEFYVSHPDLDKDMTMREFILLDNFDKINQENILYDILDYWVEDYREASLTQMEYLEDLVKRHPKKNKHIKKSPFIPFILSIILAVQTILIYKSPDTLTLDFIPFISAFSEIIGGINALLYEVNWYSLLGLIPIYGLLFYAIASYFLNRYVKEIKGEKKKRVEQLFLKWFQDIQKVRLEQAGVLEDYVAKVIENNLDTRQDINLLAEPEILLDKFKVYVKSKEKRYDYLSKNFKKFKNYLRLTLGLSVVLDVVFLVVGFVLLRGSS